MQLQHKDYTCVVVSNVAGKPEGAKVVHTKTGIASQVGIYTQFQCNKRKALDVLKSRLELYKLQFK